MMDKHHTVKLAGCAPIPLAHYLKALGILRLVSEQVDKGAQGWWERDDFYLRSTLDEGALVAFFLEEYRPTPIVVPWSGADFFEANQSPLKSDFVAKWPASSSQSRPTSNAIIESFLTASEDRLERYQDAIRKIFAAMNTTGVSSKDDLTTAGVKASFLLAIRAIINDEMIPWLDASVAVGKADKPAFNNLLGSGGGSDGNSHFSDNFMQCLWCVLPDFDFQRKKVIAAVGGDFDSVHAALEALFGGSGQKCLIKKLSPALFNSQAIGGDNATTGFTADSASNPWDYILMIEGTILFAGALSRKTGSTTPPGAIFPFMFRLSPVGTGSLMDNEVSSRGKEGWLPLWKSPAILSELSSLFSESRILVGKRQAADGLDVTRSLSTLGTDTGISEFQRIGFIRGRIGGDNYFTSVNLGRFRPNRNECVNLIFDIDDWLDHFRSFAKNKKKGTARTRRALRQLETAIFTLCERGETKGANSTQSLQQVLSALGEAEAAIAVSSKRNDPKSPMAPVPRLSPKWIAQANDGSVEYRLAVALAGIGGTKATGGTVGPMRRHLDPIRKSDKPSQDANELWYWGRPKWAINADDPALAWGNGGLVRNLIAVLQRRVIEVLKAGKQSNDEVLLFPGSGRYKASLGDVAAFIDGRVNDERIESLLRGLMLIDWNSNEFNDIDLKIILAGPTTPIPDAAYALLKLCHLPDKPDRNGKAVPLTPAITQRATRGDLSGATQLAARRLRGSGYPPAVEVVHCPGERGRRTVAALLFPIWQTKQLMGLVLQATESSTNDGEQKTKIETDVLTSHE